MTEEQLFKEYTDKICPCCKGQCNKGITIVKDYANSTVYAKCVDYEKDNTKIEGYKKPLTRTANLSKCVMPRLKTDYIN